VTVALMPIRQVTVPLWGYADLDEYLTDASCSEHLPNVRVPLLGINAMVRQDPWPGERGVCVLRGVLRRMSWMGGVSEPFRYALPFRRWFGGGDAGRPVREPRGHGPLPAARRTQPRRHARGG
jgi:hypothetical protein